MEISYTNNPVLLERAVEHHLSYRHPIRNFLLPAMGIVYLALGAYFIISLYEIPFVILGVMLIGLGVFMLFRRKIHTKGVAKAAFKGKGDELQIEIITNDSGMSISDGFTKSNSEWAAFVDYNLCDDGILLYPQHNIFYWIPSKVEVREGTWEDYTALISSKVKRKV